MLCQAKTEHAPASNANELRYTRKGVDLGNIGPSQFPVLLAKARPGRIMLTSSLNDLARAKRMSYQHKPDNGVLFVNDSKTKPNQADYTGNYSTADGTKRRVAAWINKSKNGEYLSLRFQDEYSDES